MRIWSCAAAVVLTTIVAIPAVAAGDVLRVCLDEDLPPLSVHHRGKPASGFDVALAQAIAEKLGRSLEIQWFESKLDEDFRRRWKPTRCSPTVAVRWSAVMP